MRKAALCCAVLVALAVLCAPPISSAQVRITVGFGPPALPVYEQPICPGDGYIWTPGYWAWDADFDDYYWVPGTWVLAPEVGFLWTPPWWGWDGGVFLFHDGFWGPHIGFYGGINYGFGYFGVGFVGGRWDGGHFFYNRAVANINVVNIHNVYNETVNVNVNHVSYNGGEGGIVARPRPEDEIADRDHHIGPIAAQNQHIADARGNRDLRASVNQGRPSIAATGRPGEFSGHDVMAAREAGGAYHPPANRAPENRGGEPGGARPGGEPGNARPAGGEPNRTVTHPNDLPAMEHMEKPNTGNAKQDQKYQQQQDKLFAKQQQDRQKLQQKQEQEHQKAQRQQANDQQKQQMEQRHQQQTQQMQQQHTQQRQQLQQRQAPAPRGGGGRPKG